MDSVEAIYCLVEDILKKSPNYKKSKRGRNSKLSDSEITSIVLWGHKKNLFTAKQLYEFCYEFVSQKNMPSYPQFTKAIRRIGDILTFFISFFSKINITKKSNYFLIDSTSLPTNGYERKKSSKWLSEAKKGYNMFGSYYGFKAHIIANDKLEIVSFEITTANVHDINLLKRAHFTDKLKGKIIGDKGYVSQSVADNLAKKGIEMIAKQRDNMDPYLNQYYKNDLAVRKRIETIFAQVKNRFSAVFKFCRSIESFLVHVKAAFCVYMLNQFIN